MKKSTNHKKRSIGITMVAAAFALLLVAGTILSPTQSYARSGNFTDTSSLKHAIRDGVNVNLEHRDQHMNQENLCYRDNTCRQSDVGQNTLGNDNSITGFADQSDNLQQSAAAPNQTTANKTSQTPTPTPTTATLTVIKIVSGPRPTTVTPANFTIHVTANNPNPPNFAGSATGTDVTLGPGTFNVTETGLAGFTTSFSSDCSGTIAAGQHLTCTITNTAPTPIPGACPAGTVFDVTLQANLESPFATLPAGTVLCLNTAGLNTGITAILSGGTTTHAEAVTVSSVGANNQCPAGSVVALVTSGTLPLGLSGTTVCVS
jgi:Prealbumin-like fold domain